MKTKTDLMIFFMLYIGLSCALYLLWPRVSVASQTIILGGYFILLGIIGLFAKYFLFKIPFLSDVISIEASYRILNLILLLVGLAFIANHWVKAIP